MKVLVFVITFLMTFCVFNCSPTYGVWNPLTDEQIKEALEFGKDPKNVLSFRTDFDFDNKNGEHFIEKETEWDNNRGWSEIKTPFRALATAAREKSRKYMELTPEEINAICEEYQGKLIFIQQFGTFYIPIASKFHCVIKTKGKIIQPLSKEVIYNRVYFTFPIEDIDLTSSITFTFIHADETEGERNKAFNLGNIR